MDYFQKYFTNKITVITAPIFNSHFKVTIPIDSEFNVDHFYTITVHGVKQKSYLHNFGKISHQQQLL